jgi:hypothetical protein
MTRLSAGAPDERAAVARALKNSQLAPGESRVIYGTGHLDES